MRRINTKEAMTSVATEGVRRGGRGDHLVLTSGSQSVPPPLIVSSGNWLNVKISRFHLKPAESERLRALCSQALQGDSGSWTRLGAPSLGTRERLPEKTTSPELERQNWLKEWGAGVNSTIPEEGPFEKRN